MTSYSVLSPHHRHKLIFSNQFMGIFKCASSLESNSCIWAVPKRMKSASTELIFAMRLKRNTYVFTHCLKPLGETQNALTCCYKCINNVLIFKTDFLKMKIDFKCEIKTASRWQQVSVNE